MYLFNHVTNFVVLKTDRQQKKISLFITLWWDVSRLDDIFYRDTLFDSDKGGLKLHEDIFMSCRGAMPISDTNSLSLALYIMKILLDVNTDPVWNADLFS